MSKVWVNRDGHVLISTVIHSDTVTSKTIGYEPVVEETTDIKTTLKTEPYELTTVTVTDEQGIYIYRQPHVLAHSNHESF